MKITGAAAPSGAKGVCSASSGDAATRAVCLLTTNGTSTTIRDVTKYRKVGSAVAGVVRLGKALASPIRVRALAALVGRELCLCELVELFGTAPSTMSKHMSLLAAVDLVRSRRDGRWTYYSLPEGPVREVGDALDLVRRMTADDPVVREDVGRSKSLRCR
jgi:DNA-binding transcriptional ArsR family regulator